MADGTSVDVGFQVLLTAYPELQRWVDLPALDPVAFVPEARIESTVVGRPWPTRAACPAVFWRPSQRCGHLGRPVHPQTGPQACSGPNPFRMASRRATRRNSPRTGLHRRVHPRLPRSLLLWHLPGGPAFSSARAVPVHPADVRQRRVGPAHRGNRRAGPSIGRPVGRRGPAGHPGGRSCRPGGVGVGGGGGRQRGHQLH